MMKTKFLTLILMGVLLMVLAGCGEGESNISPVNTLEESSPPGIPQWTDSPYSIENVYGVKFYVHLRWNKVTTNENNDVKDNIAGYKIVKTDTRGTILDTFFAPVRENSEVEFYTDTQSEQLIEGKEYTFRIICFDTFMNESRLSSPVTVMIQPSLDKKPARPDKPDYLLEEEQNQLTLFWSPVTIYENNENISEGDLGGYEVYRAGPDDLTRPDVPLAIIKGSRTEYSDVISIAYGQFIRYWVRAFHKDGAKSSYSDPVEVTLDRIPQPSSSEEIKDAQNIPGAAHPTRIEQNSTGLRTVHWEAPRTNTDGTYPALVSRYIVYRSEKKAGPYILVGSSISTSYSYYSPDSVNYYYRITPVDIYNNEGPLSGIIHKDILLPDINFAPTEEGYLNLQKSETSTETQNVLEWTLSGSVLIESKTIQIYRSYDPKGPYLQIGSKTVPSSGGMSLTMTYQDSNGISAGTSYYYRVTVSNSAGNESSPSHYVKVIPKKIEGLLFLFREMPITYDTGNPYLDLNVTPIDAMAPDASANQVGALTYEVGSLLPLGSTVKNSRTALSNPQGYPSVPSGNYIEFRTVSVLPATGSWKVTLYYRYNGGLFGVGQTNMYQITVFAENDQFFGAENDSNADPDLNRILLNQPIPGHDPADGGLNGSGWIKQEFTQTISIQSVDINDSNDYLYFRIWCGPENNNILNQLDSEIQLYAVEFSRN